MNIHQFLITVIALFLPTLVVPVVASASEITTTEIITHLKKVKAKLDDHTTSQKERQTLMEEVRKVQSELNEVHSGIQLQLSAKDETTRQQAMKTLRNSNPTESLVPARVLFDPSSAVRIDGIIKISEQSYFPQYVPAVSACLDDAKANIRGTAMTTLGRYGSHARSAVPRLIEIANQDDGESAFAINPLKEIGPDAREAIPLLIKYATRKTDPIHSLKPYAIAALGRVGVGNKEAFETLKRLSAKDQDTDVQFKALCALASMGPEGRIAIPHLVKFMTYDDHDAFNSKDEFIRVDAVQAIEQMGPHGKEAIPEMLVLLKNHKPHAMMPSPEVLATAFSMMGDEGVTTIPYILKYIEQRFQMFGSGPDARFLSYAGSFRDVFWNFGPKAVPYLLDALQKGDERSRYDAIEVLEIMGPRAKDALPTLRKIANTTTREGKKAIKAIERITLKKYEE